MTMDTDHSTLAKTLTLMFQRAPMLRVALALVIGISLGEMFDAVTFISIIVALICSLLLMCLSLTFAKMSYFFHPMLWLSIVAMGWGIFIFAQPADPFAGQMQMAKTHLVVRIADAPRESAQCYKYVAEIDSVEDRPAFGKILLYFPKTAVTANWQYDDVLRIYVKPQRPEGETNPHQFDYRRYLQHRGIYWQSYVAQDAFALVPNAKRHFSLIGIAKMLQHKWVVRIQHLGLSQQHQSVVEALLLGWRNDLSPITQAQFRQAGILHLLCVSGLHVGIWSMIVGGCLIFLGNLRWQRIVKGVAKIVTIGCFVLLSGLTPSAVRAGLMFSLLAIGGMMERRTSSLNHLATSACILLVFSPNTLFDVGFQLSYSAVLGILSFHTPLQQLIPSLAQKRYLTPLSKLWSWTCLSLSAQMATLPLSLFYFHQFPRYFLFANLVIVPFAGLLLVSALIMTLWGGWTVNIVECELNFIDRVTQRISSLPSPMLDNIYCDVLISGLLVVAMLLGVLFLRGRHHWALPSAICCLILVALYSNMVNWRAQRQHDMVFYHSGRHLAIECLAGRNSYLICSRQVAQNPDVLAYQRQGLLNHRRISHTQVIPIDSTFIDACCAVKNHSIVFDSRNTLVIDSSNCTPFLWHSQYDVSSVRQHFDVIVVAPRQRVDTSLLQCFTPDTIICE